MLCCLNPNCQQSQNPDNARVCQSCGMKLVPLLRNRYRVIRPIGQGGFGRTYLAVDEDRLRAPCVIKQFSPQLQGTKSMEKAVRLFNQEAVRLNDLGEHPQIPTLLAYFEQEQRLYLVQQFIEGSTLFQELQRQGPFSEQKIREVLNDILPVLKFIHSHQVIHRDITPANIIRRQIDGKLVLIDFGIAKQLTEATQMQPGTKIGTEGYAPLEQLRSGQVYPASDIYSLGATCIHLMTRVKPEELYNPLTGGWLWRDYLNKKGVQISDRLAQVLEKMLKDLVGDRYQTADQIITDLSAVPLNVPISNFKPSVPPNRFSRPISQPPAPNPTLSRPPLSRPPLSQPPLSRPPLSRPSVSGNQGRVWKCINTFTGHSSWITSVAISPSRQTIISGSLDDTIRIWNLQTGEQIQILKGHLKAVNTLAITADGQTLISGGDDRNIRIWNLFTGNQIRSLVDHSRRVNSIALSPNGKIIASGSEDRTIKLWNLANGALLGTLSVPTGIIKSVAFSPDGQTLVSGGLDNQVKIWALNSGKIINTLTGHFNSVNSITISRDGQMIASGSKDKTIRLWNRQTGELIRTFSGHSEPVNSVLISPDGKFLISGSSDKTIKFWNLATGELSITLTGHTNPVNSVAISLDGQIVVSGSWDNTIKVWQGFG